MISIFSFVRPGKRAHRFPSSMWNNLYKCLEYPGGIYIDKEGKPCPEHRYTKHAQERYEKNLPESPRACNSDASDDDDAGWNTQDEEEEEDDDEDEYDDDTEGDTTEEGEGENDEDDIEEDVTEPSINTEDEP